MKTKKALAVFLAVVMLVLPLAVSSFAATENAIVTNPVKTTYYDAEVFSPQGLTVLVDGKEIAYAPTNGNFRFEPALNELLSVETTEVVVYYDNTIVGSVPVTVEHLLGDIALVGNGHGQYCLGCGSLHNFEFHYDYSFGEDSKKFDPDSEDYDHVTEWIPNDDASLFTPQTATGVCSVCNSEITKSLPGTARFDTIFDEEALAPLEGTILYYISTILLSLIEMIFNLN